MDSIVIRSFIASMTMYIVISSIIRLIQVIIFYLMNIMFMCSYYLIHLTNISNFIWGKNLLKAILLLVLNMKLIKMMNTSLMKITTLNAITILVIDIVAILLMNMTMADIIDVIGKLLKFAMILKSTYLS